MFHTHEEYINLIPFTSKLDNKTIYVNLSKLIGIDIDGTEIIIIMIIYCDNDVIFRLKYSTYKEAYDAIKNAFKKNN